MKIKWKQDGNEKLQVNKDPDYGVEYLTYPALEQTGLVRHGFSTRLGGVSKGYLSSMNLSFGRGDDPENVQENFRRFAHAIGVPYESIVLSDQTHTTSVRVVTAEDLGHGLTRKKEFFDVDGFVTNVPGVTLSTFFADCVPLYFVDPVHKAIGLSHSGWRGTADKMGKVTVETMTARYGTSPSDVIAAIGPSICQDCYEVSEDVALRFPAECLIAKGDGKYQLDLWLANRLVMLEAGVKAENIHMPNLCTCCNPEYLYSHRASNGKRGNLGAFLMLHEKL
ncbi:MAG: peptidoglycan editing factor PgeF [Lachnospiraceae bacterium]|nr:peptidoglycan editing factor PgeF [Lachnospiraceae bacterium]